MIKLKYFRRVRNKWILFLIFIPVLIMVNSIFGLDASQILKISSTEISKFRFQTPSKKLKLVFLKTHKTSSSSVFNVLARYCLRHHLTVALPYSELKFHFNWPLKFNRSFISEMIPNPDSLLNHAVYNHEEFQQLFPKSQSLYISIFRDPVEWWVSSFYYFGIAKYYVNGALADPIAEFFRRQKLKKILKENPIYPAFNHSLSRNPGLHDLGFSGDPDNDTVVIKYVDFLMTEVLDVVMIKEFYDLSMIMLQKALNTDISEMVGFSLNDRVPESKNNVDVRTDPITSELRKMILEWNNADVILYEAAMKKFTQQYKKIPNINESANKLRAIKINLEKICISHREYQVSYARKFYHGYALNANIPISQREECKLMITKEIDMIKHIRKVQMLYV